MVWGAVSRRSSSSHYTPIDRNQFEDYLSEENMVTGRCETGVMPLIGQLLDLDHWIWLSTQIEILNRDDRELESYPDPMDLENYYRLWFSDLR